MTQCQIAYSNGTGLWSDTNFNTNHVPLIFSDNYVHDNIPTVADYKAGGATFMEGEAGIKVEVSSYVDVINNIVVRNGQVGILFAGCENCVAENNTIVGNYGFAAFMANTDGERGVVDGQTWVLKNNVIRNNIIANNSTTYDLVITSLHPPIRRPTVKLKHPITPVILISSTEWASPCKSPTAIR